MESWFYLCVCVCFFFFCGFFSLQVLLSLLHVSLSDSSGFSLLLFFFFLIFSFLNHQDYVLIVRVLLLEHSHEVVSTSSIYFVKLVLDVRRPAISNSLILEGRKVAQAPALRYLPSLWIVEDGIHKRIIYGKVKPKLIADYRGAGLFT